MMRFCKQYKNVTIRDKFFIKDEKIVLYSVAKGVLPPSLPRFRTSAVGGDMRYFGGSFLRIKGISLYSDISLSSDRVDVGGDGMVNLSSPKTFEIIEYILEKKQFTQYRASKELKGISFGLINKVSNWLLGKRLIARRESKYFLSDPAGIISAISIYRDMKQLKILEADTSLTKAQLMQLIPKSAVFCLDSALGLWSSYYKSGRVCAYLGQKEADAIKKRLLFKPGNASTLCIYMEKPLVKQKKEAKGRFYTGRVRAVVDMFCDDRAFAAEMLYKELWGKSLG